MGPNTRELMDDAVDLAKRFGGAIKSNLAVDSIKDISGELLKKEGSALANASEVLESTISNENVVDLASKLKINIKDAKKPADHLKKEIKKKNILLGDIMSSKNISADEGYAMYKNRKSYSPITALEKAQHYYWGGANGAERATRIGATAGIAGSGLVAKNMISGKKRGDEY